MGLHNPSPLDMVDTYNLPRKNSDAVIDGPRQRKQTGDETEKVGLIERSFLVNFRHKHSHFSQGMGSFTNSSMAKAVSKRSKAHSSMIRIGVDKRVF